MAKDRSHYPAGPTDGAEPPMTAEDLIALAHAHRQDIPYETGEQLLERLPERLRALANVVLSGQVRTGVAPPEALRQANQWEVRLLAILENGQEARRDLEMKRLPAPTAKPGNSRLRVLLALLVG